MGSKGSSTDRNDWYAGRKPIGADAEAALAVAEAVLDAEAADEEAADEEETDEPASASDSDLTSLLPSLAAGGPLLR